jgi:YidC/Oxa1 family membrane protein insertase
MGGIWSSFVGLLEWLLVQSAIITGSATLGIVLFTIGARLVILPLTLTSLRSNRRLQELQPQIKELQRKYGKEPQKLQEETLRMYREHKINPAGGCLPLLLQLPIFFGVYQAVYNLMGPNQQQYLSQSVRDLLADPAVAQLFATPLFGVIQLGEATWGQNGFNGWAYLVLPILSIVLQLLLQLMATPRVQDPQTKAMMQAMMFMPIIFGYIGFTFPQGAVLYWVVGSLFGIVQQYFISGWGSLANHLTFLPPDPPWSASAQKAALAAQAQVSEEGGDGSAPQRADFWSVMRPLTEQTVSAVAASDPLAPEPIAETVRQQPNPRRQRRRR